MKALTVYQPYASAIVSGLKHYETRTRRTTIRGRVAVHAGLKLIKNHALYKQFFETSNGFGGYSLKDIETGKPRFSGSTLDYMERGISRTYGAVIGTVEIVDCLPVEAVRDKLDVLDRLLGDYRPGRFAWVLANPVEFNTPIPARGRQGWWNWQEPESGQSIT